MGISCRTIVFLLVLFSFNFGYSNGGWFDSKCSSGQFECKSGECIDEKKKCDDKEDCKDGSDESEILCGNWLSNCLWIQFECKNGDCIEKTRKCDGKRDCKDGSDESESLCGVKPATEKLTSEKPLVDSTLFSEEILVSTTKEPLPRSKEVTEKEKLPNRGDIPILTVHPLYEEVYQVLKVSTAPPHQPTITAQNVSCNITGQPGKCCYTVLYCVECNSTITTTTASPGPSPQPTLFQCATGGLFIDIKSKCNQANDCPDGSDEFGCPTTTTTTTTTTTSTTTPGTPEGCAWNEFECVSGQCIKNSEYCDGTIDCQDGSDEPSTCKEKWPPKPTELPRSRTELHCVDPSEPSSVPRNALQLECKFVGEPTPRIFWKKYESFVPAKCQQSSVKGHGVLFCPDFEPSDQGAYSCVAENAAGAAETQPKSIAVCSNPITCNNGFKIIDEQNIENCFECYCSNKTKNCHNIKSIKKVEKLPFPETQVEVFVSKNGSVAFVPSDDAFSPSSEVRSSSDAVTYCSVHDSILKKHSFVKSYGRSIIIPRKYGFPNFAFDAPDLIIRGHGLTLTYTYKKNLGNSKNVDIRFWRGHFHHVDKSVATRFDLMRVLANIDALLIRCEYWQGAPDTWDEKQEIQLESAVIEENADSASYLERCICPTGYSGLSCEVCAPDYEREEGTDLCVKKPEPPPPCDEGYIGENCDECDEENGYYRNTPYDTCSKINCNINGTMGTNLFGKCICKENVKGEECNTCKPGSFNLNSKDYFGCTKCWCNGVSEECESSNWRRSSISSTSYGGYNSSDGRNFWLLPSEFNGNRLTSYGGRLDYTIKYAPNIAKQEKILEVEFLSEDNETMVYYHPDVDTSTDKELKSWSVKIEEQFWRNRDGKILSRFEMLKALLNIKAIYIESPYHLSSGLANLTLVRLDIAEKDGDEDGILATDVEVCKCPEGYTGLSCERCSKGYMRDENNRLKCVKCPCANCDPEEGCQDCPDHSYDENYNNKSLGKDCKPCPCNNNEKSCWKDDWNQILCSCKAGYSGPKCENKIEDGEIKSRLKVTISPNKVKNKRIGTTIIFNCSYESTERMTIRFKKVYSGKTGDMDTGFESESEGPESAKQYGSMRSLEVVLDEGLQQVECFVYNSIDMEVGHVMAIIEGVVEDFKQPKITNCYFGSHKVKEEGPLSISCEATGSPIPEIIWYKNDVRVKSVDGVLSIEKADLNDSGIYRCEARNMLGNDVCNHNVVVEKKCLVLEIIPERVRTEEGEDINLLCKASEDGKISWKRLDKDLPYDFRYSTQNNGRLSIKNATTEDSGEFVCVFTNKETTMNKSATVIVERKRTKPTASILESDSTINTGEDFEINCIVTGYPEPTVSWKFDSLSNVEISNDGKRLDIRGATLENQGIYQCFAISSEGNSSEAIYIAVKDSLRLPKIAIRPNSVMAVVKGDSVEIECEVLDGIPAPNIRWIRLDGEPVNLEGNILSFTSVSLSDHGRYLCVAENEAGKAEASLEIDVLYPPKVTVSPTEVSREIGEMVLLHCEVVGNPLPKPMWKEETEPRYLKRTAQDVSNNQTDMLTPRNRLGLYIQVLENSYKYTCIAENTVGKDQATIRIHPLKSSVKPNPGDLVLAELGAPFIIECEGITGKVEWSKKNGYLQGDECEQLGGLSIPSVQVQHKGTYICKSVLDPSIKKEVTLQLKGFVNKFSNERKSFMVLPMKTDSSSFGLDVTFRPENPNGLLLLEKEHQTFVIYLKDGKVHARLNLNEPVELIYDVRLSMGHWYSAMLNVNQESADLLVYGEDGKALIGLLEKDIEPYDWSSIKEVYLGGTNKTKIDFQTMNKFDSVPFEGCVSRFVVDDHEYKITQEGLYSREVRLCKLCQEDNPCKNAGECLDAPSHYGFICVCPNGHVKKETTTCPPSCAGYGCTTKVNFCELLNPCNSKGSNVHNCIAVGGQAGTTGSSFHCSCALGYSGTRCDKVQEFSFHVNGNGYAKLDSNFLDRSDLSRPEQIEIEFTPASLNGVLLWQGDNSNYLYIGLKDGYLEYVYNNLKTTLKSEVEGKPISLGHTHRLVSTRRNGSLELIIDDNKYEAYTDYSSNRVKGDIYLGASPISVHGRFKKGLVGCINYVAFGNKSQINILQEGVKLHNAEKKCSSQNDIDSETNEVDDSGFSEEI